MLSFEEKYSKSLIFFFLKMGPNYIAPAVLQVTHYVDQADLKLIDSPASVPPHPA